MRTLPRSALIVFAVTFIGVGWIVRHTVGLPYALENADGDWQLVHRSPWLGAVLAAVVAAVLATSAWTLLRRRLRQSIGRSWPHAVVASVAAVALAGQLAGLSVGTNIGCDGSVPRWMLPATYDGEGCIPIPVNIEDIPPEALRQGDRVCLGMCT